MDRPDWVPEGIDVDRPSAARVYDYWLGGSHNFAADREVARGVINVVPDTPIIMQRNRAFLHRAVRYLVDAGIRQFLDLGSGIPTLGNVHEVAQKATKDAKVVYVDVDPVAVAHSRHILAGNPNTVVIQEDLRNAKEVLTHPDVRGLLNFDEPVALLLVAILHFVTDAEKPGEIVSTLRDALPDGSFLVLSHATGDLFERSDAQAVYKNATASMNLRSHAEVERYFDGFDLLEPGLTQVPFWRPDGPLPAGAASIGFYGGVGRK